MIVMYKAVLADGFTSDLFRRAFCFEPIEFGFGLCLEKL